MVTVLIAVQHSTFLAHQPATLAFTGHDRLCCRTMHHAHTQRNVRKTGLFLGRVAIKNAEDDVVRLAAL